MKGRKLAEDLRENRITVQVTENEKIKLKNLAKKQGLTVSDYIRSELIYKNYNKLFGGEFEWTGRLF